MASQKFEKYQQNVRENVRKIRERIGLACDRAGRDPKEIRLLLMTQSISPDVIAFLLEEGEARIGEKNGNEWADKRGKLQKYDPEVHFLGTLSRGKLDSVLENVDFVQTVDHYDMALEMNQYLDTTGREMNVLIRVNTSFRKHNGGIIPEHAIRLALQLSRLPMLKVRGLMMPLISDDDPENSRKCFRLLKNLSEEVDLLNIPEVKMDYLSMGTDHDFEMAIEEGSTMVRVGAAIFGTRENPDRYYWDEEDF